MKKFVAPLCLMGSLIALPAVADNAAISHPAAAPTAPAATATATPVVVAALPTDPAAAAPAGQFVATHIPTPLGDVGVVNYVEGGVARKVVEIPGATSKQWNQYKRAQTVCDRLTAQKKAVLLRIQPVVTADKQHVLQDPDTGAMIITADKDSAALKQMTPTTYAFRLQKEIIGVLSGLVGLRDAKFDYDLKTPDEKRDRAILYRQQADDRFAEGTSAGKKSAEQLYLQAIKVDPSYAVAYLELSKLYTQNGDTDKAQKIQQQAGSLNLDLKAEASDMQGPASATPEN